MKNKTVQILLIISLLICCVMISSCSEPGNKENFTVGVLNPNKGNREISSGFIEGLKKKSTKQIIFIEAGCKGTCNIEAALTDLMTHDPDLLFTVTTPATKKAKEMTKGKNVPVIFAMHDPVGSGIINSLASPGGNLTGIQIRGSVPKALDWLLSVSPAAKNIFVPVKFDTKAAKQSLSDLKEAAETIGVQLVVAEVDTLEELKASLDSMPENIHAIFLVHSILTHSNTEAIVEAAIKRKLPIGAGSALYENGVTVSYGLDTFQTGKQASRLANMALQGEPAGSIPTEVADYFLGINLITANAAGLEIPNDILIQADYIIR